MAGESVDDDQGSRASLAGDVDVAVRAPSFRRRARARQVSVVNDVFTRCQRVAPTRRAEVLAFFLESYRHSTRAAFGRERQPGTKADAFLFAVVIEVAAWPGWDVGVPGRLQRELRAELTRVFEQREPYRSAVKALGADPASVSPRAVRNHLHGQDYEQYNKVQVRQHAAFTEFVAWIRREKAWLAALLGLVPVVGGAGSASAAAPTRPFASTWFGTFILLVAVPALVGTLWHLARQSVLPRDRAAPRAAAIVQDRDDRHPGQAPAAGTPAVSQGAPPALARDVTGGGLTWAGKVSGTRGSLTGIAWSGARFVAVGYDGAIVSSPDGETWERTPQPATYNFGDVTYGNGLFVAVGSGRRGTHLGRLVASSSDGLSWDVTPWFERSALGSIAFGGGVFVAVGTQGAIVRSIDGETWDTIDSGTGEHLDGVSYLNGRFVVIGHGGTAMTSTDGQRWEHRTSAVKGGYFAAAFGRGRYVAPGQAVSSDGERSMVWTSPDASAWTEHEVATGAGLRSVTFTGDRFFATTFGNSGLLSSHDGLTWVVAVPGDLAPNAGEALWTGSHLIVVGAAGAIFVGAPAGEPLQ